MSKNTPSNSDSSTRQQSRREALRRQQEAQARQQRMTKVITVGAIIAVLAIIAVVAVVVINNNKANSVTSATQINPPSINEQRDAIVVNPGKAQDGAPVVRVYQDYQCPFCKSTGDYMNPPLDQLASQGEIQLEYSTMTFLDQNLNNTSSMQAALAASCADVAGKFLAFHDAVYDGQPSSEGQGYTSKQLEKDFPAAAGITGDALTKYTECYKGRQTEKAVKDIDNAAGNAGITSTPTYQVNGKTWDLTTLGNDTSAENILKVIKEQANN